MTKHINKGRDNYYGVTSQSFAAMSLFLQSLNDKDFSHIIFEGNKLEDFCLVYSSGKKIICESKASHINYTIIRKILDNVIKHQQLNINDEILIVCKSIDSDAESTIRNYKYFGDLQREKMIKKKGFTDKELKLLPQVRIWKIEQEFSELSIKAIIARMITVWIPDNYLKDIVSAITLQEAFVGSQTGKTLMKNEFLQQIKQRKEKIIQDSSYMIERKNVEKRLDIVLTSLKNNNQDNFPEGSISSLTNRPSEFYYIFSKLKSDKPDLDLAKWNTLWNAASRSFYTFELFDIFENSIDSKKYNNNKEYILSFCMDLLSKNYMLVRDDFVKSDIVKLCKKYLEKSDQWNDQIFEIIKLLFAPDIKSYFYLQKDKNKEYEHQEIAGLLLDLFKQSDKDLGESIFKYIKTSFNLVEDEGEFWFHTPPQIFTIVKEYCDVNLSGRLPPIIDVFISHFEDYYRKFNKRKTIYKGWELSGSGIGQDGNRFHISDRHFVDSILIPLVWDFYKKDSEQCWDYLIKNCISRKITDVGTKNKKPDFLNRASIPVLINEYAMGNHSKEAFSILCDFIKMRRGIPWKNDIIFQNIKNDTELGADKKFELIKFSLKTFNNLPVNIFVEQIVTDFAIKGNDEAIKILKQWSDNPEYMKRQFFRDQQIHSIVDKLLDNPKTFQDGVGIFKKYINQEIFVNQTNKFDTYDLAKNLSKIVEKDYKSGIQIIRDVYKSKILTINQQILIFSAINSISDKETLKKIYDDFIHLELSKLKTNKKIESRITEKNCREDIIQFAEKLAKEKYFEDSLWLIKLFVNDSDPREDGKNDPDDKDGSFNYHQHLLSGSDEIIISTVRGWCAQVLSKFALLPARKHIDQALDLLEKFAKDRNYYVRYQSCLPLSEFAHNRRTVLPTDKNELFMTRIQAERIESIAFNMLHDNENYKASALIKRLVYVFTYMRGITENKAKDFTNTIIQKANSSGIAEASVLFIYFAYFRKNDFHRDVFKIVYGRKWQEVKKFDDKYFKEKLNELLVRGDSEIRQKFSWQFWRLPVENEKKAELWNIAYDNLLKILDGKYDHNVFSNIYYFIKDNLDKKPKECINLWKKCIKKEKEALKEELNDKNIDELRWRPFHYNGLVLLKIAEIEGNQEFLKWFNMLLDYPNEIIAVSDSKRTVELLMEINDPVVEEILNKFVNNISPSFIEYKQAWLKKYKGKNETK